MPAEVGPHRGGDGAGRGREGGLGKLREGQAGAVDGAEIHGLAAGGLGLSLDTVRYGGGDSAPPASIIRLAWGERVSSTITGGLQYASWRWGAPLVLAVVLLVAALVVYLVFEVGA